jgi:hypothetical protein
MKCVCTSCDVVLLGSPHVESEHVHVLTLTGRALGSLGPLRCLQMRRAGLCNTVAHTLSQLFQPKSTVYTARGAYKVCARRDRNMMARWHSPQAKQETSGLCIVWLSMPCEAP